MSYELGPPADASDAVLSAPSILVTISFLKLLFAPLALLIITGFFYQFNYPNYFLGTFLVSIGPCGAFSLALCAAYNVNPSEIVKAIFVTTVISFFILTLFIGIVLNNL